MQESEVQSSLAGTAQRVEQNRDEPAKAAAEAKIGAMSGRRKLKLHRT